MTLLTPYQTAGPFFALGLPVVEAGVPAGEPALSSLGPPVGSARDSGVIAISGRLLDGRGEGMPDGALEFWHPAFAGIRRALTAHDGSYAVTIERPWSVASGRAPAPVSVRVLGRGILTEYLTRIYFSERAGAFDDPAWSAVPQWRRDTLVAVRCGEARYTFDVVLQGARETVFFDPR